MLALEGNEQKSAIQSQPLSDDVLVYDFETNKENTYAHSDFAYSGHVSRDAYYPTETSNVAPFGIQGSAEAYYKMPYSAICTLFSSYDTNGDGRGDSTFVFTATLVGADVALTAEECTYHPRYGYPTSITLCPGMYSHGPGSEVKPFGEVRAIKVSRGNYEKTKHPNDNWAILYLKSPIGKQTGWLGVSDDKIAEGDSTYMTGQKDDKDFVNVSAFGNVKNLQTYSYLHDPYPEIYPTMVGAAVRGRSLDTVHGIHTSGVSVVDGKSYSQVCKVSVYIENWLQDSGGLVDVTIFARQGDPGSELGHAWLSVENRSKDKKIIVGRMEIEPNDSVSLGTWPLLNRWGIWYNREYLEAKHYPEKYASRVSLTKKVFLQQWESANQMVLESDWWMPIDNCVKFAIDVWNTCCPLDRFEKGEIPLPETLKGDILKRPGHQLEKTVPGTDKVGYYQGDKFVLAF